MNDGDYSLEWTSNSQTLLLRKSVKHPSEYCIYVKEVVLRQVCNRKCCSQALKMLSGAYLDHFVLSLTVQEWLERKISSSQISHMCGTTWQMHTRRNRWHDRRRCLEQKVPAQGKHKHFEYWNCLSDAGYRSTATAGVDSMYGAVKQDKAARKKPQVRLETGLT